MKLRTKIIADDRYEKITVDIKFESKKNLTRYETQSNFNYKVDAIYEALLAKYHAKHLRIVK